VSKPKYFYIEWFMPHDWSMFERHDWEDATGRLIIYYKKNDLYCVGTVDAKDYP
jgi:hypothetical protein